MQLALYVEPLVGAYTTVPTGQSCCHVAASGMFAIPLHDGCVLLV